MIVIPAIDLLEGSAVRLYQGDFDQVVTGHADPIELAQSYCAAGARALHLVDLEGARSGRWCNLATIAAIAAIARGYGVQVQAGGGARDRAGIAAALSCGVESVIIATAALLGGEVLSALTAEYADSLIVSLDSRGGAVLAKGWASETGLQLVSAARAVIDCGISRLIHTSVARDGTLSGPDLRGLSQLLPLGVPVMVAGGVTSLHDLSRLAAVGASGAIVGRALQEGRLDPVQVLPGYGDAGRPS